MKRSVGGNDKVKADMSNEELNIRKCEEMWLMDLQCICLDETG